MEICGSSRPKRAQPLALARTYDVIRILHVVRDKSQLLVFDYRDLVKRKSSAGIIASFRG